MPRDPRTFEERLTRVLKQRLDQGGPWPREVYRHVERASRASGQTAEAWLDSVATRPLDFAALIAAATVGHTAFFRHPDHFEQLRRAAQRMVARSGRVRVWSAACSTGEEAWSIALCLKETGLPFQVWASDVNSHAVQTARTGIYPARATAGLPGYDGRRPFHAPAELRASMKFWTASIADALPSDAPPQFDVVFCRNVMIYFSPERVAATWKVLLQRSAPWGAVAVAPVESLSHVPGEVERRGPLGWMELRTAPARLTGALPLEPVPAAAPTEAQPSSVSIAREFEEAARLLSAGNLEGAEQKLHALLAERDDAFGWFLLGEAYARRKEHTQARVAYERAARARHVPDEVDLQTVQDAALRRARQLSG